MFEGRTLLIATKHKKEQVIAPILESLGLVCEVSTLDTDEFGTFSGEVERSDDPIATARKKCLAALENTEYDLAVASEGSFGQHPLIFFAPADDEFLFFLDKKQSLEIIVRELSTETNFNGKKVSSQRELDEFARGALFPSHALILRKRENDTTEVTKGITNWQQLHQVYQELNAEGSDVYVETDMRAMFNPTRMKVIEKATQKLLEKIQSACPECTAPGFGIVDRKKGLPCEVCHFPTQSTLSYLYVCQKCTYSTEEKYPNGKTVEEPQFCDVCNP